MTLTGRSGRWGREAASAGHSLADRELAVADPAELTDQLLTAGELEVGVMG